MLILALCAGCAEPDIDEKGTDVMRFGKNITFKVAEDETVDFEHLQKVLDGEIKRDTPYFHLWSEEDLEKLIKYMETNNYVIVPGEYTFNQGWIFEDGAFVTNSGEKLEILRFRVKTM
ncbi:MAG: hypothetical protein LBL35_02785 [Clostridiales bacterium]|nr:hypothetical protein [Clostridiales bacterium]